MKERHYSVIRLSTGMRIDSQHLAAWMYGQGYLKLVLSSGHQIEEGMDEKRGEYWLTRFDAERGGSSPAIAPIGVPVKVLPVSAEVLDAKDKELAKLVATLPPVQVMATRHANTP